MWLTLRNTPRLRRQDTVAQERVTRPALDAWGAELMVRLDARFDAMEAAQSRREQERMAYLLKNAEELGGVRSTNQLLTGQLATLAAKLDRQIELTRLPSARRHDDHRHRPPADRRDRRRRPRPAARPARRRSRRAARRARRPAHARRAAGPSHRRAPRSPSSLPALADWTREARAARDERRFDEFLADVRRAAERAEAFRDLLAQAERIHQVNVALLAARLFDALVARDPAAIERLAHTFAAIVSSSSHYPLWLPSANSSKRTNGANSCARSSCASATPRASAATAWA